MSTNPMQRKVTNAFLLGMVLMLLLSLIGGAAFYMFVFLPQQQAAEEESGLLPMEVFVVIGEITYGEELIEGVNLERTIMDSALQVPFGNLFDEEGNPLRARIPLEIGVILTETMTMESEPIGEDVRYIELNMLSLPIDMNAGDYVDIRLKLSTGQDMIVLSRKPIIAIHGETVTFRLAEHERLILNSAIVEMYVMNASNLHLVKFVDPSLQRTALVPTYQVSPAARDLIARNENIATEIRNNFRRERTDDENQLRNWTNYALSHYAAQAQSNIESGMSGQIRRAREAREQFLMSIHEPQW